MPFSRRAAARVLIAILLISTLSPTRAMAETTSATERVAHVASRISETLASIPEFLVALFSDATEAIAVRLPSAPRAAPLPSPTSQGAAAATVGDPFSDVPGEPTPNTAAAAPTASTGSALAAQTPRTSAPSVSGNSEPAAPALDTAPYVSPIALATLLAQTRADILAQIPSAVIAAPAAWSGGGAAVPAYAGTFGLTQRIDNLSNTTINTPTITGGSISGATIAGYLPLSGGELSGALTGTDLTLSGGLTADALSGPYFTATSTTATSSFAGAFTAASSAFSILQNGKVGIGTTSPRKTLEVAGDVIVKNGTNLNIANPEFGFGINNLLNPGGGGYHTVINGIIGGSDGGTGHIAIGGSVNAATNGQNFNAVLGIGTNVTNSADSSAFGRNATITNAERSTAIGYGSAISSLNDTIALGNASAKVWVPGSVGIGTTSPAAKLGITGSGTGSVLLGEWGGSSAYGAIGLNGSLTTTDYNFTSGFTDKHLYINRPSGSDIKFREQNVDYVTFKSGGNVGIGTTTPTAQLSTTGTVRFSNFGAGTLTTDASGNRRSHLMNA